MTVWIGDNEVAIVEGNNALIPAINAGTQLWIDAAVGDDNNDGLTPGTAFATLPRAFAEIPNHPDVGAGGGFAFCVFQLVGAGPYQLPLATSYDKVGNLALYIQGDLTSVESLSIPSWSLVAGKRATWEASPGVYSTSLVDGSHFLYTTFPFGGATFASGVTLDGAGSVPGSGTIRAVSSSAPFLTGAVDLAAFTSKIVENDGSILRYQNRDGRVILGIFGCHIDATAGGFNSIRIRGTFPYQSKFTATGVIQFLGDSVGSNFYGNQVQLYDLNANNLGVSVPQFSGLLGASAKLLAWSGDAQVGGCVFRGAAGPQITIGGGTFHSSVQLGEIDFEPTGTADAIRVDRNGVADLPSFDGMTFNGNVNRAMIVPGGNVRIGGPVTGSCKLPIEITDGGTVTGLAANATGLNNTVTPGDDVKVGADPGTYSWASLPKTDLGMGDSSQLCRAE